MKKQITAVISTHPVRAAFLLILLFLLGSVMHQALGQGNIGKRSVAMPNAAAIVNLPQVMPSIDGTAAGTYAAPAPNIPALAPASAFRVPVPKLPNAKGTGRNASIASLLGNIPLLTYMIDDGTAEDSIGLTSGGTFVACNSFPVTGGNNVITSISIAWGTPAFPDPTLNGLAYTAVLWSDPNGDGSPTDAVVLAMAPGVISQQGTDTFITTVIPPTVVTTANFFVGFVITHTAGQFPAAIDETAPTLPNRSWVDQTANINDLSGAITIESVGLVGNWLIRAEGSTGGGCSNYTTTTSTGTITPGTTDSGNHCDDCATAITFPFPVSVYGQTFNSANVASNGALDLIGAQAPFTHGCQVLPNTLWTMAILPYQDDLRTDQFSGCAGFPGGTCGVFTSVTGTAPNRHFNVEWRAVHFANTANPANFEVVFSENQSSFDVIYGATSDNGLDETSGVQASSTGAATTFSCGAATLTSGLKVTYACAGGGGGCTPAWQNEPPIANARRNPATVAVGSNLYAITGFDLNPNYSAANERFNGTTWTALAPIPVPHAQSRGAAVGTNIYVPGGFNNVSAGGPLDTMQIYNTTTNAWSAGMVLPAARSGVATAAFNGLVYVIGGYNPVGTGHNEVYIYNPGTNSYTTGAPMTATQGNVAGVLFNGEIYVVGGGTAPGAQYAYNPTTNVWRTIAVLPTTGGTCQSDNGFVLNNELWVVGCLGLAINQQVWIYNPGSNSWRAGPPYTVDHQGPGAALFNGRGFAVGGGTAGGGSTAVESVGCAAPVPSSAVSRKVHGAFTGDINLPLVAIGGAVGIECRNGAGGYQMVVTFPSPVTVGGVSVTSGTGSVGSSSVSGGVVTINLTGVTDAQRLGVTLANVNDGTSTGDVLVPMGVLIGDSAGTGNGSVNAGDVGFVKSVSGQTAGAGNFRADIAINGTINASDVGLVKANSGHLLPP